MIFDLSIANHYFTGGVTIALSQRSITGRVRTKTINLFNKLLPTWIPLYLYSSKTAYFVHRLGLNYEPLIPSFIGETKVHNKRGSPITVPCKITLCGNCTRPKRNVSEFHDYFNDWKWKSVTDPRKFFYTNRGLCNHTSGKSLKLDLDFAFRQASDT